MYDIFFYAHMISAIGLLLYLFFPLFAMRLRAMKGAAQASMARTMIKANRIGQYILIVALLSGGYMVSKVDYSVLWMIVSIVLILVMFALAGMSGKPLKKVAASGTDSGRSADKVRTFSLINALCLILLYMFMYNPGWL